MSEESNYQELLDKLTTRELETLRQSKWTEAPNKLCPDCHPQKQMNDDFDLIADALNKLGKIIGGA